MQTAPSILRKLGMPVALATLITAGACSQEPEISADDTTGETYAEEVAEKPETLETVVESPELYLGTTVEVVGEVVETYGSQAYVIQEEEYFAQEENLLVVNSDSSMPMPEMGEYVELTGEMQLFAAADLNKDYDVVLDQVVLDDLEVAYAELPFVLAKSIEGTEMGGEETAE